MNSTYIALLESGQISSETVLQRESNRFFDKGFRMAKAAGFALSLAVSPITAMSDPWLIEKKRRGAVVTVSICQEFVGRSISRAEALRITRQILENAEKERLAAAEFEATLGIQWGD